MTIASPKLTNDGKYKCGFTHTDIPYSSEGTLTVRLVTINPSTSPLINHNSEEYKLTCILQAATSDSDFEVSWTGPDGDLDNSGKSDEGSNYIYTLTTPTAEQNGEYKCDFTFTNGRSPSGTFTSVLHNIITMVSPETVYTTQGTGITVTLSCQVTSDSQEDSLTFYNKAAIGVTTTRSHDGGKTTAKHEIVVANDIADDTYTCKINADVSPKTTTVKVLTLTGLDLKTRGNDAAAKTLMCSTEYSDSLPEPTIKWYIDSATEEVDGAVGVLVKDGSSVVTGYKSSLDIIVNAESDNKVYKCEVKYTGVVGGDYESSTTVIMNSESLFLYFLYLALFIPRSRKAC